MTTPSHYQQPKTFKAPAWVLFGIHLIAHNQDISDSVWIKNVMIKALVENGFTAEMYDDHLEQQRSAS